MDPLTLSDAVLDRDRRALARAISVVEDSREGSAELLSALYPHGGKSAIIGITGAPGSGKSTLVDGLIARLRSCEKQVAVVAVDPSSPFTGGALLGDRVRMQRHASDPGVFVRSMSSRGHLGGLAVATSKVLVVLEAAGFDPILVETVGVGQSEVEVVDTADTTVVVLAPGWGDAVQAAKAGILEIGDVFVVNKADLPGADQLAREVTRMLEMGPTGEWSPPVVTCAAAKGEGVDEVGRAIEAHQGHLVRSGELERRRRRRAETALRRAATTRFGSGLAGDGLDPALVEEVVSRRTDPWAAVERIAG